MTEDEKYDIAVKLIRNGYLIHCSNAVFNEFDKAYIKGGKAYPNINGVVTFKETKNGILVTAKINGLPQAKNRL